MTRELTKLEQWLEQARKEKEVDQVLYTEQLNSIVNTCCHWLENLTGESLRESKIIDLPNLDTLSDLNRILQDHPRYLGWGFKAVMNDPRADTIKISVNAKAESTLWSMHQAHKRRVLAAEFDRIDGWVHDSKGSWEDSIKARVLEAGKPQKRYSMPVLLDSRITPKAHGGEAMKRAKRRIEEFFLSLGFEYVTVRYDKIGKVLNCTLSTVPPKPRTKKAKTK